MHKIRSKYVRGSARVEGVRQKLEEGRLRWCSHVQGREPQDLVRRVMELEIGGARRRGRPKKRWKNCMGEDLRIRNISPSTALDPLEWKHLIKE